MFNPVFLQASDDTYGSFVNLCKIKFHTVRVSLRKIKWFVLGERDFHCTVHVLDLRFFFKIRRIATPSVLQSSRTIACALLVVSLRTNS